MRGREHATQRTAHSWALVSEAAIRPTRVQLPFAKSRQAMRAGGAPGGPPAAGPAVVAVYRSAPQRLWHRFKSTGSMSPASCARA